MPTSNDNNYNNNNNNNNNGKTTESTFLFHQLSVALQMGNAVAFLNTFDSD